MSYEPPPPPPGGHQPPYQANTPTDAQVERPWYKKKRYIIPLAAVVLLLIGVSMAGADESADDGGNTASATPESVFVTVTETGDAPEPVVETVVETKTVKPEPVVKTVVKTKTVEPEPAPEPEPEPEPEPDDLTVSQENARGSAADYLEYAAFSRTGLIEQLEFEGYSTEDATFAVDSLTVNWNEQAAKSAKDYLSYSSFSRSGLIEQLIFEGYTREQAEYGVNQTGL